ncbi:hypothetical protein NFJ02_24g53980 [Pycnococcus provasolii]
MISSFPLSLTKRHTASCPAASGDVAVESRASMKVVFGKLAFMGSSRKSLTYGSALKTATESSEVFPAFVDAPDGVSATAARRVDEEAQRRERAERGARRAEAIFEDIIVVRGRTMVYRSMECRF